MQLERLERERIKLYKQHLKQQMEKQEALKKHEQSYRTKRDHQEVNEMLDYLNQAQSQRLKQRKDIELMMKAQNMEISQQSRILNQGTNMLPKQKSFVDDIHQLDSTRIDRLSKQYRSQSYENTNKKYIFVESRQQKRRYDQFQREVERWQDQKHLNRMKQMQEDSQNNYKALMQKHSQNMELYQKHEDLMTANNQYRKTIQKFTETERDVLNHLWRNQKQERKNTNMNVQEELKKQIQQFNSKRRQEKSDILEGQPMQKGMLKSLLHDDSYDKRSYAQVLKGQMEEEKNRRSSETNKIKEKYYVSGIYGGEHGRERTRQIQYIDKKLGILPKQNTTLTQQHQNNLHKSMMQPNSSKTIDFLPANNNQEYKSSIDFKQTPKQSVEKHPAPKSQPPSLTPRYYRSYDLVSGYNKFYNVPSM